MTPIHIRMQRDTYKFKYNIYTYMNGRQVVIAYLIDTIIKFVGWNIDYVPWVLITTQFINLAGIKRITPTNSLA